MGHTVSHTVNSQASPAIDAESLLDNYLYISVCYVVFWRSFGYPRMGKNYSHSIVPGGFEVMS